MGKFRFLLVVLTMLSVLISASCININPPVQAPTPTAKRQPLDIEAYISTPDLQPSYTIAELTAAKTELSTFFKEDYYASRPYVANQYKPNDLATLKQALADLQKLPWQYKASYFDCSEMSTLVELYLEVAGFDTVIVVGKDPNVQGPNHAWVVVFLNQPKFEAVPVEATILSIPKPKGNIYGYPPNRVTMNYQDYFKSGWVLRDIYEALVWQPSDFDWWNSYPLSLDELFGKPSIPSPVPSLTLTPIPTPSPIPSPTPTLTPTPTFIPTPTSAPTPGPTPKPTITLNPTQGVPGTSVTVTGSNFGSSATVRIYFGNIDTGIVKIADDAGNFTATFAANQLQAGTYVVKAEDNTYKSATANYQVLSELRAFLSKNTGSVGTQEVVAGTGFKPNTTITIRYDEKEITEARTTTDASGSFQTTFKIPVSTGGNHTITITDGTNSKTFNFAIETIGPAAPILIYPIMNTVIDGPIFLDWQDVTDDSMPVTYNFQISTEPNFNTLTLEKKDLKESRYTLSLTAPKATKYYWTVQAVDAASNKSAWAKPNAFIIPAP